ncbi:DUF2507 domain-containing protein [Oceanobacillus piezotolerans]|uniref:DUF2507 domain-containing protein n=1 Tax=Oceanobacillus piezotolerans TaxID=2448030 RepID=A0A498DCG8_9BACI|nr:YslB family protein [Oceanobacillus piezotolerans]RLL47932.1 DUF2507 domain-containing protein [Oceanobacillus piezotolerans]
MSKKLERISLSQLSNLHTSGAGYDVLRYIGLPELLGKDSHTLLYFLGKSLARKFEISSMDDLSSIMEALGWGRLELIKEKKNEFTFQLMSDAVVLRLDAPFEADFRLEAGFLAEAIQKIRGFDCECLEEVNRRIKLVKFTVFYTDQ